MRRYRLASYRGLVVVRAAAFRGDKVSISKLVVDTGASRTVLSWAILEGLGYDPAGVKERVRLVTASGFAMAPQVTLDRFHCLGQEMRNLPVVCHDLPFDHYVDGLLGMDFLKRFDFAIRLKREAVETDRGS